MRSAHHKALGDVAETNRFDNLALDVQRDLDMVSLAHRRGGKIPKFRFEQKSFNIVKCNTDLAETDFEVQIVRGISYNVTKPREVDTFVKLEVPNPQVCNHPFDCVCVWSDCMSHTNPESLESAFIFLASGFAVSQQNGHHLQHRQSGIQ